MSKYNKVYFNINTPSYYKSKHGVGFENQEDKELFNSSVVNAFLNDGWEVKKERYSGGCTSVIKDKQELYLHPQQISGVVKEQSIPNIENIMKSIEILELSNTNVDEEVFDITDDRYIEILQSKSSEIESDLLEVFKTKRSNLYVSDSLSAMNNVLRKYRIKRLTKHDGSISSCDLDWKFFAELFEKLVTDNKIVTAKTRRGTGYRTDKKMLEKQLVKSN